MEKLKCAWFDFSGCEGCQVELTNLGEPFVKILNLIEPVEFREVMSETYDGMIDIAFVEGSFTREADRERLKTIRKRAKTVVAYGACAVNGGINALKNHFDKDDYKKEVYGKDKDMPHLETHTARPISSVIHVDYAIPGCPIDKYEFLDIVNQLVHGANPVLPKYPVCVECKLRETVCRYQDGDYCLGVVAKAGCGAPCPSQGIPCEACRGFCEEPNMEALQELLETRTPYGKKWADEKTRIFTANLRREAR
jgi:coenzyme F420-reducing hydrogenase gamma subunit